MDQKIKIKIAGREYELKSKSPESEELIRKSAAEVNKKISAYQDKFPQRNILDLLSFVALNETMDMLGTRKALEKALSEASSLKADLEGYLENIARDSR